MSQFLSKTSFDFMRTRWITFALSMLLIVTSLALLFVKGLNYGIDFTGGIVVEVRIPDAPTIGDLRKTLTSRLSGNILIQHIGSTSDFLIKIQHNASDSAASPNLEHSQIVQDVKTIIIDHISPNADFRKVDFVGPQVSQELLTSGIMAMLLAFLAILTYIWFRFELQFGFGAIIALIHDTILTVGFFSLLDIEFNLSSIAAVLTIIGYSINDSVVIYDRIRENLRKYKSKPLTDILNRSLNQTLSRTLLTAGSTIAALVALIVFGGNIIQGFSLAVLFGVIIGTYSSIYIAAPILLYFNIHPTHSHTK